MTPAAGETFSARIGNWCYDRVDRPVLIGPSARPVSLRWRGEAPGMVQLSALDWARDAIAPAASLANRLARPDQALAPTALQRLQVASGASASPRRAVRPEDEPLVAALDALVEAGEVSEAAGVSARLAAPPHRLRRVALAAFGFPVKTLLTRRRFLCALAAYRRSGVLADAVGQGYFDKSHFFRDAQRFLGTTPRRFVDLARV